jgi:hypothetical protein
MVSKAVFGSVMRRLAAVVAGLAVCAPSAFAQAVVTQYLEVRFEGVFAAVPLSDWLTAGTALLLAAAAAVALHRRGGRLFGALLAVATGAVLLSTAGQRIISEARAGLDPQEIDLVSSPGKLDVSQFAPQVMGVLQVTVKNTTVVTVKIDAISLTLNAPFKFAPPGPNACFAGEELAPGAACIVYLELPPDV